MWTSFLVITALSSWVITATVADTRLRWVNIAPLGKPVVPEKRGY